VGKQGKRLNMQDLTLNFKKLCRLRLFLCSFRLSWSAWIINI